MKDNILTEVGNTFFNDYKYLALSLVGDNLINDFLSHCFIEISKIQEEKLITLHNTGGLRFYIIRLIINQGRSTTSSFYYEYIKPNVNNVEFNDFDYQEEEYDYDTDISNQTLAEHCKSIMDNFRNPADTKILNMYLIDNISMGKISSKLGVNKSFIYSTITRLNNSIKRQVSYLKFNNIDHYLLEIHHIKSYFNKRKLNLEEKQHIIDFYNFMNHTTHNDCHSITRVKEAIDFIKKM